MADEGHPERRSASWTPEEIEEKSRRIEEGSGGQVRILNPRGEAVVSRRFLERLGELPPSSRELAIARACAQPWRDRPEELPECYRVELDHARWAAQREREVWDVAGRAGEGGFGEPVVDLDYLFADEPEPILAYSLQVFAGYGPLSRRHSLARQSRSQWKEEPGPRIREAFRRHAGRDFGEAEQPPEWIVRREEHFRALLGEQHYIPGELRLLPLLEQAVLMVLRSREATTALILDELPIQELSPLHPGMAHVGEEDVTEALGGLEARGLVRSQREAPAKRSAETAIAEDGSPHGDALWWTTISPNGTEAAQYVYDRHREGTWPKP